MSTTLTPPAPAERLPEPEPAPRRHYLNVRYGVASWLLTQDHKRIAILYIIAITVMFFLGGAAATWVRLELMTPQGNRRFSLAQLENRQGQAVDVAPGDGRVLYLPLPENLSLEYGLLLRDL